MQNKKGFTLVELLAVIVVLAVVMVIATTAIGPILTKTRKGALGSEGLALIDAAKMAYQAEQMASSDRIKSTESACFSLKWLKANGYYESKKDIDGIYNGSVLITYVSASKSYTYTFWISNEEYIFDNVTLEAYNNYDPREVGADKASDVCGTFTGTKRT